LNPAGIAYTFTALSLPAYPMKFKNVVIQALAAVDPPIRITSKEIEQRLKPTLDRLGERLDQLDTPERQAMSRNTISRMTSRTDDLTERLASSRGLLTLSVPIKASAAIGWRRPLEPSPSKCSQEYKDLVQRRIFEMQLG